MHVCIPFTLTVAFLLPSQSVYSPPTVPAWIPIPHNTLWDLEKGENGATKERSPMQADL